MSRLVPENRQVLGPSHIRLVRGRRALMRLMVADGVERSAPGYHWMQTAGRGRRLCRAGRASSHVPKITQRMAQAVRAVMIPKAGWDR